MMPWLSPSFHAFTLLSPFLPHVLYILTPKLYPEQSLSACFLTFPPLPLSPIYTSRVSIPQWPFLGWYPIVWTKIMLKESISRWQSLVHVKMAKAWWLPQGYWHIAEDYAVSKPFNLGIQLLEFCYMGRKWEIQTGIISALLLIEKHWKWHIFNSREWLSKSQYICSRICAAIKITFLGFSD